MRFHAVLFEFVRLRRAAGVGLRVSMRGLVLKRLRILSVAGALVAATGCSVGPTYVRPALDDLPTGWREGAPWKPAEPGAPDRADPWWTVYGDPTLGRLMLDAGRANQSLRVAEAQYRQAAALADQARAALFPSAGVSVGAQRARTNAGVAGPRTIDAFGVTPSASWAPDFWGGVRSAVEAGEASAAASADDLANALLSIQTSVAQNYFSLRTTDQQRDLYAATIEAYTRALKLTRAQRAAGVGLLSDVALAESQLASAQAQATDLEVTRSQFEHALAILTGRPPVRFVLPAATVDQPFAAQLPATPVGLPSELLERRPDIAAAERRAAAANANIGVARAAYFPSVVLSASGGFSAATFGTLFDAPARVWSLGAALAQTLFDGGLRRARDAQAVAALDAASAQYKQTVLGGFQQVEDNLAALQVLEREITYQADAVRAGQTAERLALVQYRAGTTTFLTVVTAQTLSLTNQRTAVALRGRQFAASVGLIAATGGGWRSDAPACVAASTRAASGAASGEPARAAAGCALGALAASPG